MKYIWLLIVLVLLGCNKNLGRNCPAPGMCDTIALITVLDTADNAVTGNAIKLTSNGTANHEFTGITDHTGVAEVIIPHVRGGVYGMALRVEVANYVVISNPDFIMIKEETTEYLTVTVQ